MREEHIGEAVFAFVQALLQVSDLRLLEREIVRSTFREDLTEVIITNFPHAIWGYFEPRKDPEAKYPIHFLLNGVTRPVAVFGITSDESALAALVTAKRFAEWHRPLRLVAVESDQEQLASWVDGQLVEGDRALVHRAQRQQRTLHGRWCKPVTHGPVDEPL